MAKSKYPQQLDTSVELPPVRDNITEIGSDVINSLRSAIFQIEKTLGINPQGAVGNTLASRIDNALDDNGNILQNALNRSNVLSGPILDVNVSSVAAIQESKLKLNFPTTLLQDEISVINGLIDNIIDQIEELNAALSAHIHIAATNRHPATAISMAAATVITSDAATLSLSASSLQTAMETLYNAHINYSGVNISSTNNSHTADQIYFDNSDVSGAIDSSDVQGALEDLATAENTSFRDALLNLHSNGRIRAGSVADDYEGTGSASVLISSTVVTYTQVAGSSRTTFTLTTPQAPADTVQKFDILTLSGSATTSDNKDYQISSVTLSSGRVTAIEVYGGPVAASSGGLSAVVSQNPYTTYNASGFASTVRPRSNRTNTPDIQIANPDAATVVSSGINPTLITATTRYFDISIDNNTDITIDAYDSTMSVQTLLSVINRINEQCVDQHLNFMAYRIRISGCYELALVHNVPNISGDYENRTLSISASSSNDATTALGFGDILGLDYEGESDNAIHLNGQVLNDFGLIKTFTSSTISIVANTLTISLSSGTFLSNGVRVGDIAVVSGSSLASDDGSYRISSINGAIANLDLSGATFGGELSSTARVHIIRTTAPIDELTFEEIGSVDGSIMFDVFMTGEKDIHYSKRMEIEGALDSGAFTAVVSDVSRNFILADETSVININTSGYATLTGPDLLTGDSVFVANTGRHEIFGSDGMSFVVLEVRATDTPFLDLQVTLYGYDEISENNYHLSRGSFATSLGRILGESNEPGVPSVVDKRISGSVGSSIVSEDFIERYIEGPRNELRASGVIRGCEVGNAVYVSGASPYQLFDVGAGIIVVNGIRYEFPGQEDIRIDTSSNFYVVMDGAGCIQARVEIDDPLNPGTSISPFFDQEVAHLAYVWNSGGTANETDLRLFIDNIDFKLVSDISVANDARFSHFTDLNKAVAYARRFSYIFPQMGHPSILIKEGNYSISEQITLDFDITIRGSGPNTLLTKTDSFAQGTALVSGSEDNIDMSTALFLIGGGQNSVSSFINAGVVLKDFAYRTSSSITDVGCVIAITQDIITSKNNTFVFDGLVFVGPSTITGSPSDPANWIGEYAIVCGRQNASTLVPTANHDAGNIIVTNCRFRRIGVERGAIKMLESSGGTLQNVTLHGNVATEMAPNIGSSTFVLLEYPTTPTVTQVVEVANVSRYS